MRKQGHLCKKATYALALKSRDEKDYALKMIKRTIIENSEDILKANQLDIKIAKENNRSAAFIDRLSLNEARILAICDGIDEVIGRFRDLPDIIVDLNRKFGNKDLKIRNFIDPEDKPIITTFGMYLNKISFEDRQAIIDRLNKLQQNEEEISDYKLIDIEDLLEYYKSRDEER